LYLEPAWIFPQTIYVHGYKTHMHKTKNDNYGIGREREGGKSRGRGE
jgi:hypothetical protein